MSTGIEQFSVRGDGLVMCRALFVSGAATVSGALVASAGLTVASGDFRVGFSLCRIRRFFVFDLMRVYEHSTEEASKANGFLCNRGCGDGLVVYAFAVLGTRFRPVRCR